MMMHDAITTTTPTSFASNFVWHAFDRVDPGGDRNLYSPGRRETGLRLRARAVSK